MKLLKIVGLLVPLFTSSAAPINHLEFTDDPSGMSLI
jgi:hypothetical protein